MKYGLTLKEGDEYFYFTGIPLKLEYSRTDEFEFFTIKSGDYMQSEHQGKLELLPNTVNQIFRVILPSHRINPHNNGLIFIEKYGKRFHWNRNDSIIDIFIKFQNKS